MFLSSFPIGVCNDFFVNRNIASKVTMRKFFNSVGMLGPAVGLVWLAFVGCDSSMAVAALVVASTLASGVYAGFNVSIHSMR